MALSAGTLVTHFGAELSGLIKGAAQAQGVIRGFSKNASTSLGSFNSALHGTGRVISGLAGTFATITGAYGIGLFIRETLRAGATFEFEMRRVAEVTKATAKEYDALVQTAKSFAETTEFGPVAAAEGLRILALAGFDAAESMKALGPILDFATAGQIKVADAADFASQVLRAYKRDTEDLTAITDILTVVANKTNVELGQMIESFRYASPLASAMGVSIGELAVFIGQLANAGTRGSIAGTQLGRAIEKGNEAALEFGTTSGELLHVLDELAKRGATPADFQQLFGTRGGRAALLIASRSAEIKDFAKEMEGAAGATHKLATALREEATLEFKNLGASIEVVLVDAFKKLEPELLASIKSFAKWVRDNKEEISGFLYFVLNSIAAIVKATVELAQLGAIDDLIKAIGKIGNAWATARTKVEEYLNTTKGLAIVGGDLKRVRTPKTVESEEVNIEDIERAAKDSKKANDLVSGLFADRPPIKRGLTAGDDKAAKEAQKQARAARRALDEHVRLYQSLLERTDLTVEQITDLWENFKNLRILQIQAEAKELREQLGPSAYLAIAAAAKKANEDIERDKLERIERRKRAELDARIEPFQEIADFPSVGDELGTFRPDYAERRKEELRMRNEVLAGWEDYHQARLEMIELESQAEIRSLVEQGRTLGQATATARALQQKRIMELDQEYIDFFEAHRTDMENLAIDTAQGFTDAFHEFFLDEMRGDFVDFYDYLEILTAQVLSRIADLMSAELLKIFSIGKEGGGGGGLMGFLGGLAGSIGGGGGGGRELDELDHLQHGGLVTKPTIAMIGEGGPEFIIPADRFEKMMAELTEGFAVGGRSERLRELFAFQHGGLVTRPTLGMVGEAGPELVMPLNRLSGMMGRSRDREPERTMTVVNQYIESPDVPAFKRSQSQLAAQAAAALARGRRNS